MSDSFNNILVVRTDRIGDVILTTPSLKALRQTFLKAKISVLVSPVTKELLVENPDIDEVLVDDRKNEHKGFGGFLKLISSLKKKQFDLAVVFHTKKRTNALCFLTGIPRRIGYRNNKFGFLLTDQIKDDRHLGTKHEAQYCLDLLQNIGVHSNELEISLKLTSEAEQWAEQILAEHNLSKDKMIVAIHPLASDPDKMWALENFAELINILKNKYSCEVIVIGISDTERVVGQLKLMTHYPIIDLVDRTTVSQLAALFKRCNVLISNDSGPVHLADAVGTPVISIFTRNHPGINPERWRPLGAKGRVVFPQNNTKIDQMRPQSVPTSVVLEAVDSLFKLC